MLALAINGPTIAPAVAIATVALPAETLTISAIKNANIIGLIETVSNIFHFKSPFFIHYSKL